MSLHKCFSSFDENIKLSESRKNEIIRRRNAVREKIRNRFKEMRINQPKFMVQGSFCMHTALNPLYGEVDVDDGLYLQNSEINECYRNTWPEPKKIHREIVRALENHTKDGCESKTSCVRVIYKNDFHVDIPVYIMAGNHAYLADTKLNEWIPSDSKDFKDWFFANRKNEQTSRIVRYLKAWRDFTGVDMASIELTILAVKHHVLKSDDGEAMFYTVKAIYDSLYSCRSLFKPVSPCENLWEGKKNTDKILQSLKSLKDDLYDAVSNDYVSDLRERQFGYRFPKS